MRSDDWRFENLFAAQAASQFPKLSKWIIGPLVADVLNNNKTYNIQLSHCLHGCDGAVS